MKWLIAVGTAVALTTLAPLGARAANSITWDTGSPKSIVAGQITGSATIVVDAGWTNDGVVITANEAGGGSSGSSMCTLAGTTETGTVIGLTKGQKYHVFMQMNLTNGIAHQTVVTATVDVTP